MLGNTKSIFIPSGDEPGTHAAPHPRPLPLRGEGKGLRIQRLYSLLYNHFGPQHWWPAETPFEMMVGAILTQNTAWANVEKAIESLKQHKALTLKALATLPRRQLERLIRSSGFFRQKAERLQSFVRTLKEDPEFFRALCGHPLPSVTESLADARHSRSGGRERGWKKVAHLRERLLARNGIGPETADSILLYAGNYPSFVVDAYTRRIGQRMGLFKTNDYHEVQAYFKKRLPQDAALYNEFHALLVMLAKHFCTSRNPECQECPVRGICVYGRRQLGGREGLGFRGSGFASEP